jgi:hypothetical protein
MKQLLSLLALIFLTTLCNIHAELQGAWISSVHNINFPAREGMTVEEQKAQAVRLLDAAKNAGLNAVLLQVRPEGDALYASQLEPWSRFLTGTQGRAPGYDPLAFFISEAKARGLEVHAWINPYRAAANISHPRAPGHISRQFPQYAYRVGTVLYMDPGAPEVRRRVVAVVRDLATRYPIAGVHLDDYFYPYPINDKEGKPVGIQRHIGRRPIAAFGNSDGDFEMLEYTTSGAGPRLGMLLHHDDGQREFAYDRKSSIGRLERGLDEAARRDWAIVSMKNDWRTVY